MEQEASYQTVDDNTYWVLITVHEKLGGPLICFHKWENFPWAVRMKWNWFFTYRAARYQVQYPKARVELKWGSTPKTDRVLIDLKNRLRAKRGKITEITNKIAHAEQTWNSLFPLVTEPRYQAAVAKLTRLRGEEVELANQLTEHLLPTTCV